MCGVYFCPCHAVMRQWLQNKTHVQHGEDEGTMANTQKDRVVIIPEICIGFQYLIVWSFLHPWKVSMNWTTSQCLYVTHVTPELSDNVPKSLYQCQEMFGALHLRLSPQIPSGVKVRWLRRNDLWQEALTALWSSNSSSKGWKLFLGSPSWCCVNLCSLRGVLLLLHTGASLLQLSTNL